MIFLISGTSQSGKSTLAREISRKLGYSYFPLDSLVSMMESLCPACGVKHEDINMEMSPRIAEMLSSLLGHLEYEDLDMVVDTYQLLPEEYCRWFPERRYRILFMGYPDLSPAE